MSEFTWRNAPDAMWGECATFAALRTVVTETLLPNVTGVTIRNGLIEEAFELLSPEESSDRANLVKEVGDNLWFHEAARGILGQQRAWPSADVQLNCYQRYNQELAMPITGPNGRLLVPRQDSRGALAVTTLRLVDTMNPKDDELWRGVTEAKIRSPEPVLRDHLAALAIFTLEHDISFTEAVQALAKKHAERQRKPHVVETPVTDSARGRLEPLNPWVAGMISKVALQNMDISAPGQERMVQ